VTFIELNLTIERLGKPLGKMELVVPFAWTCGVHTGPFVMSLETGRTAGRFTTLVRLGVAKFCWYVVVFFDSTADRLCKLLLDEERPKMRELPCARDTEYRELDERPAHNSGIGSFALVSELCFSLLLRVRQTCAQRRGMGSGLSTYPLKHLFSSDVHQSPVQLLDLAHDALHLVLVIALDLARCANGHI
jgi:hypothetical protein